MFDEQRRKRDRDGNLPERTAAPDQPCLYRARLFDDSREVLADRTYPIVLDLTPGAPLEDSAYRLDALLRTLLRVANVRGDKALKYHLDIRDWVTGASLMLWPVTWEPE